MNEPTLLLGDLGAFDFKTMGFNFFLGAPSTGFGASCEGNIGKPRVESEGQRQTRAQQITANLPSR